MNININAEAYLLIVLKCFYSITDSMSIVCWRLLTQVLPAPNVIGYKGPAEGPKAIPGPGHPLDKFHSPGRRPGLHRALRCPQQWKLENITHPSSTGQESQGCGYPRGG